MQVSDLVNQYYNSMAAGSEVSTKTKGVEQLVSTVSKLTTGQVFEGTVNRISGNQVILGLSSGQNITATLDKGVSLTQGQSVFFQVKSSDGNQVQIKPISIGTSNNPTLLSALDSASLPVTERNLNMVNSMMKEQMPIDSNSLAQMSKLSATYPNADVSNLVSMSKLDLPINEEMIQQFSNYKAGEGAVLNTVSELTQNIPATLLSDSVSTQDAVGFLNQLNQMFSGEISGDNLSNISPEQFASGEAVSQDAINASGVVEGEVAQGAEAAVSAELTQEEVASIRDQATTIIISMDGEPELLPGKGLDAANQAATAANTEVQSEVKELSPEEKLAAAFQSAEGAEGEEADALNPKLIQMQYEGKVASEAENPSPNSLLSAAGKEEFLNLASQLKEVVDLSNVSPSVVDENGNLKTDTSVKDFFTALTNALNGKSDLSKEDLAKLLNNPAFKSALSSLMEQQWTISPEKLTEKGAVKRLYEKIDVEMSLLKNAANEVTKDSSNMITQTASSIQDNVEFMNHVNEAFTYVQIPLQMSGQQASADLYVYTNKNKNHQEGDEISAFLHFDMDHLGSTDIAVKMKNKSVDTKFFMEDDASYELISNNIHILQARLEELGYNSTIHVENDSNPVNLVTDVMQKDVKTGGDIQRYSFDVRA